MFSSSVQIYALIILLTLSMFFVLWYLFFIMFRVPDDNREYFDDPPLFYKIFGFFINIIAFYLTPAISEKTEKKYEEKIVYAGVEYQFKPAHIIASKIFSSTFFSIISLILVLLLNQQLVWVVFAGLFGFFYPDLWLKEATKKRNISMSKNLPFFLDMITLSVESGLNLNGALVQAAEKSPPSPVKQEFEKVVRDIKTGVSRADAFRKMSLRTNDQSIKSLVSSIIQAEKMGMNLGPILRSQAEQRRIERFQKAEKMAMEAPVKLLFPLVAFIFPCTFIVIGFPVYVMIKDAF